MPDAAERGYRSSPRGVRTRRAAIYRWILSAAALAPLMFGIGLLGPGVTEQIVAISMEQVPAFELDPVWPRIPAEWKLGDVSSVAVDAHDHVWVLHRPRTLAPEDERMAAPPVLEFDPVGNVVRAWGGPADGLEWPEREHGIHVDDEQNVWIGGNNCVGRRGTAVPLHRGQPPDRGAQSAHTRDERLDRDGRSPHCGRFAGQYLHGVAGPVASTSQAGLQGQRDRPVAADRACRLR